MDIRFLQNWAGRAAGQVDSQLNPGVADVLIQRGIAERIGVPAEPRNIDPTPMQFHRKRGRPRKS